MAEPISFYANQVLVRVYPDKFALGEAAAVDAAAVLRGSIERNGAARIIVGAGNSQLEMVQALVRQPRVDWGRVEVFHMDSYVGLTPDHPASLRRWVRTYVTDVVHPGKVNYILGDAADIDAECHRYGALLEAAPIDITFFGIGENGHIAFNEPGVADFDDPVSVKRIRLDERSQRQQVGEGHFRAVEEVPREALTITCPVIARSRTLIGSVPDLRKADAVRRAIQGGLSNACPASMVFTHPNAFLYLDTDSASALGRAA